MKMKTYEITLKHDNGTVSLLTRAGTYTAAKRIALESEGAHESAILYWRVVPTKRGIAKTKSLLRGL